MQILDCSRFLWSMAETKPLSRSHWIYSISQLSLWKLLHQTYDESFKLMFLEQLIFSFQWFLGESWLRITPTRNETVIAETKINGFIQYFRTQKIRFTCEKIEIFHLTFDMRFNWNQTMIVRSEFSLSKKLRYILETIFDFCILNVYNVI